VVAPPVAAPIDLVPLESIFEARMLRRRPKKVDFQPCPRLQEAHWRRGYYPSHQAAAVVEREAERPKRRAAVEQREAERPRSRAVVEQRETERPRRQAAVEQRGAERPKRRAVVEREIERPKRRAAAVPNCRLVPPLQVDSMCLAPLVVPDAANPSPLHLPN
jgi:hypothetical protein